MKFPNLVIVMINQKLMHEDLVLLFHLECGIASTLSDFVHVNLYTLLPFGKVAQPYK